MKDSGGRSAPSPWSGQKRPEAPACGSRGGDRTRTGRRLGSPGSGRFLVPKIGAAPVSSLPPLLRTSHAGPTAQPDRTRPPEALPRSATAKVLRGRSGRPDRQSQSRAHSPASNQAPGAPPWEAEMIFQKSPSAHSARQAGGLPHKARSPPAAPESGGTRKIPPVPPRSR